MRITIELNEREAAGLALDLPAGFSPEVNWQKAANDAIDAGGPPAALLAGGGFQSDLSEGVSSSVDATDAGGPPGTLIDATGGFMATGEGED